MIVDMLHLDLVAVSSEKEVTLDRLRDLGAVHLDFGTAVDERTAAASADLLRAERALRLIASARGKRSRDDFEIRPREVGEVIALDEDRVALVDEAMRLTKEIQLYGPYGDFDPALARKVSEALLSRGLKGELDGLVELPARLPEMRLSKLREKLARIENRLRIVKEKLASADERVIAGKYPLLQDRLCSRGRACFWRKRAEWW